MRLPQKKYDYLQNEQEIFKGWQNQQIYEFYTEKIGKKPLFIIDTPPPYTNAAWHIGGAIHYSQIDIIARIMRMQGFQVLFPIGLDRNGLPIEIAAEKEFDINMHQISRTKFLQLCQQILDKYGSQILNVAYDLGMSCSSFSWDKVYKTDSPQYRALTQATFIELWRKGMIYEATHPTNWDPKLQTTIADAEIEYKEGIHTLYEIEFTIKETGEIAAFATTRPELIPAIKLIAAHPDDERYSTIAGFTARVPLWDIEVPILQHTIADPQFGTGLLQICSYGDLSDIRVLRELKLQPTYAIGKDGRLTAATGKYCGMTIAEGRTAIVADLQEQGAILSQKEIPYRYPISDRSGAAVEFIGMPEFYLQQERFIPMLQQYAESLKFHPEHMRQIWKDWLAKVSIDWPISRQRYYGTPIPLWQCKSCGHRMAPDPGEYYEPWKNAAPFTVCERCRAHEFVGETRILDTWMDSSISSLYITQYPNNAFSRKLQEYTAKRPYLVDLRTQGKEIVRTWLHYTMLRIQQLKEKPAFQHVWISGHVVTESGEKMSKRKGNSVAPEKILKKYGGDLLRLFGAMEATLGSDIRYSEQRLQTGKKLLTKVYNLARFISTFPESEATRVTMGADKWILAELNLLISDVKTYFTAYNFQPAMQKIRTFIMNTFASHYVEMVKNRAYNSAGKFSEEDAKSARNTLYMVLYATLKLLAPITPFITEYIYLRLKGKSIHTELLPTVEKMPQNPALTEALLSFNASIWKKKKDTSLKQPITYCNIPAILQELIPDLVLMHNIQNWQCS